jgi:maltooligosyltrehalose trehalohydrolase
MVHAFSTAELFVRHYSIGAELRPDGGVSFRVWAPGKARLRLVLLDENGAERSELEMSPEPDGYFAINVDEVAAGDLYGFRIDQQTALLPDPASRFQPFGPTGPSQVVDPSRFSWSDAYWQGVGREGQVLYEMHIGTFTNKGTYASAAEQLAELAHLGVTVIEFMPLAEFPGRFGWGYDGVCPFAPSRLYGTPDDLRRFINRAHGLGLGVILDVVYNHLGPVGQSLEAFSEYYLSQRHKTDWGNAVNFDGPGSAEVRDYFLTNAAYWVEEYHFDGFRFDATQDIHDSSEDHILSALARRVRAAAKGRSTLLIAENEPQDSRLVRAADEGGFGLDALWNDDFHHVAVVALTGRAEAYFSGYRGGPQEFISAAKYGFLYQGQWYSWQKKHRGTPSFDLPPAAFVNYIENHDQVANSLRGQRCHALVHPGCYRAMTALLLLAPGTPLLFQGQEFASSRPFCFFADLQPSQADSVREGRAEFLSQFPSLRPAASMASMPDPADPATFSGCKLDFSERIAHEGLYVMHRELLRLRRQDATFGRQRRGTVDGAVLGPAAFVLRCFGDAGDDRLLIINLGIDTQLDAAAEPLMAPPRDGRWWILWSSDDPRYGGSGIPPLDDEGTWTIPGCAATVLAPNPTQS